MKKMRMTALLISAAFIAVCGVLAATQQTEAAKGKFVQGRYTANQLNNKLENGLNTAVNWDTACKQATAYAMNHSDGNTIPNLRNNYIDNGSHGFTAASYRISTWLSLAGQPANSDTITLKYGTASVKLQINNLNFLCGTLVSPSYGSSCTNVKTSAMYNDAKRWVNAAHPDSAPNEVGNACLEPARTATYTYVNDIQVVKNNGDLRGSVSIGSKHPVFTVKRDNNSRYWFANPVALNYVFAGNGVTTPGKIELLMHVKQIAEYNNGSWRCSDDNGNSIPVSGPNDFGACSVRDNDISMKLNVQLDQSWNVTPTTSISQSSRKPGQTYTVTGKANNNGDTASKGTNWQINQIVYGPNQTPPSSAPGDSNTRPCAAYQAKGSYKSCGVFNQHKGTRNFAAGKQVQLAKEGGIDASQPAGSTICYFTAVNTPTPAKNPAWRYSKLACVKIVYSYGLTPSAGVNPRTVSTAAQQITVTSTVTNDGSKSYPTKWYTTRIVYAPGVKPSTKYGDSSKDPCAYFGNNSTSCDSSFVRKTQTFTQPTTNLSPAPKDTAGADFALGLGTSICYAGSVSTPTQAATPVWRHSKLACVTVAKSPKVQVWGGDLKVYHDIMGSTSASGGKTYGSWGEYGVFADGSVSDFASGSGLNGVSNLPESGYEQLTFANTSNQYGQYGLPTFAALASQFAVTGTAKSGSVALNSLPSGNYTAPGNLTINQSINIQANHTIIINAQGTVTIKGDITYDNGPYTNIDQIPQVIIVAPRINISEKVQTIDAWLLATDNGNGTINTCSEKGTTAALTSNDCNQPLTINGPVETDQLYLRRTAGSDDDSSMGDPAEVLNLRADAYLWAYRQAGVTGQAETVYTTELPPRF